MNATTNSSPLLIGNAQAFWGDSSDAPARLVQQSPDLDVLTLDYLAEVSMSILARQRQRDPNLGYARDFIDVIRSLAPSWKAGRNLRLITNAGGLNPTACAKAAAQALRAEGCPHLTIAILSGDDVLPQFQAALAADPRTQQFRHLETAAPLETIAGKLVTANAYLGAESIAAALNAGAAIIITGRVADPSLTVGPCMAHFGWRPDDYNPIAGATVAGHLIECGTQVTGGISTDWLNLPRPDDIGFPIVQVHPDGSCIITKPPNTGGQVTLATVKEQLVYEIADPAHYLSPDVTASFLPLTITPQGTDRIRVAGATGNAPPSTYKVSATYRAGFRASGMLTIFGRDAAAKARKCGQIVLDRLARAGLSPRQSNVECLGAGAVAPGILESQSTLEVVLRISVADDRSEVVERFTREIAPLVTSGPQGTTGYAEGRPPIREVFGYWPTLIDRAVVCPRLQFIKPGETEPSTGSPS